MRSCGLIFALALLVKPAAAQEPNTGQTKAPATSEATETARLATFDEGNPFPGLDEVRLTSPWRKPRFIDGLDGQALRFDGYSTFVDGHLKESFSAPATLAFDIAVWSWPVARAGLVVIHGPPRIAVGLNQWGRLVAVAETDDGLLQAITSDPVERGVWQHVALSIGGQEGGLTLYVDGKAVAQDRGLTPNAFAGSVTLGFDATSGMAEGGYLRGVFNGAMDRVRLSKGPANAIAMQTGGAEARNNKPNLMPDPARFANDPNRPVYHPMPPAGWTNEPHGLIHANGAWRMWYQANPNGPWWDHMQWGMLVSDDLGRWTPKQTSLWPTPGFDRAGIWVGDVVPHESGFHAVYTGVNGQWAGVGVATATTPELSQFKKIDSNPVIVDTPPGYQDMRDPFIIRRANDWLMLIGSGRAAPKVPAILTYSSDNLIDWTFEGELDMGAVQRFGTYWELPKLLHFTDDRHALIVTTLKPHTPARTQYWIGSWDGERFVPDDPMPRPLDLFSTHLAHSTYPMGDGRHAAVGIVPETSRTTEERLEAGWIHGFSLARTIALSDDGRRLVQQPAEGAHSLFSEPVWRAENIELKAAPTRLGDMDTSVARVVLVIDPGTAHQIILALRATPDLDEATRLRLFPGAGRIALDFSESSTSPTTRSDVLWDSYANFTEDGLIELTLFVDRSFVDAFTRAGDAVAFRTFPVSREATAVFISAEGGDAVLREARISLLKAEQTASDTSR